MCLTERNHTRNSFLSTSPLPSVSISATAAATSPAAIGTPSAADTAPNSSASIVPDPSLSNTLKAETTADSGTVAGADPTLPPTAASSSYGWS